MPVPPDATNWKLYAELAVAGSRGRVVIVSGEDGGSIVIDRAGGVVSVSDKESVTCGVKVKVFAVDGVPEITPVLGLRVTSVGSVPDCMLHVSVPVPGVAAKVRL